MTDFLIKTVETQAEFRAAMAIQEAVFVAEQGIPVELTLDSSNSHSTHLIAMEGEIAVGTARLVLDGGDCPGSATIARVAVLPGHRKSGIGRKLVSVLEEIGRRAGACRFVLYPHLHLEGFYQAMGYERRPGGEHDVAGLPLITMEKIVHDRG